MPKIFVSYRRDDSEHITGRIYDRLEPRFGRNNVFMDIDAIPFGVDFREHLDRAVGQCEVLLAVIGEQWLNIGHREGPKQGRRLDDPTDFVRIEIQSALARGVPVIPVLVGRAGMPGEQELPEGLKGLAYRNAAEVRSGRDFRDHVDRLIRGIEHLLRPKELEAEGKTAGQDRRKQAEPRRKEPRPGEIVTNSLGMKFAWIPPGTFLMGSPPNEPERSDDETQHRVTLTKGFWMGVHQVTQAQWQAVMGGNPSNFKGESNLPVENVSWDECVAFCEALGHKDSKTYRLPTEAEWEYACRAGATTPFHFGDTISVDQANYDSNYTYGADKKGIHRQKTTPVGSFPPNTWGLYDMHGNVWEWCQDWYGPYPEEDLKDPQWFVGGDRRVCRGGSWGNIPGDCRSAFRIWYAPAYRYYYLGCRVALCLD